VHTVPACRAKSKPKPEDPGRDDVTGRYEQDASKPQFTCQINQAGAHIEGWLQFVYAAGAGSVLPATDAARIRPVFVLSGDRDPRSGEFRFVVYDDWSPARLGQGVGQGLLRARGRGRVEISMTISAGPRPAETVHTMLRPYPFGGKVPRLSNHALNSLTADVREELKAVETHPLPTPYVTELRNRFSPQWVRHQLAQWYAVQHRPPSERNRVQQVAVRAIEGRLRAFYLRFHRSLWPTISWHLRMHLSCYRREEGSTWNLLEDVAFIATRTERGPGDKFVFLGKEGLGLKWRPAPPTEPFFYRIKLRLWQVQRQYRRAGAGIMRGTLSIDKRGPGIRTPKVMQFDVRFTVVGIGADVGLAVYSENEGIAIVDDDWQPSSFQGDAIMYDLGAWWAMYAGVSLSLSKMRVYGSKAYPAMTFDLSGTSPIRGQGAGVGGAIMFGYLTPKGQEPPRDVPVATSREFPITGATSTKSHFDLGCAVLDTEGREAIRRFCAQELFYLQSPHSAIRIDADTDSVDCQWRNKELSELRAANAFQAMKDTLGKKAPVSFLGTELKGHGEARARGQGKDGGCLGDGVEDRNWRKVEVFLNGRGQLRMHSGTSGPALH
jgi:hypothetical protein